MPWRAFTRSVRGRLLVAMGATTFAALFTTAGALVAYDVRTYEAAWVSDLASQADIVARASAPALAFNDRKVATENLSLLKVRPRIRAAALYTRDGRLFASYRAPDAADVRLPDRVDEDGHRVDGSELSLTRLIQEGDEPLGAVYVLSTYELRQRLGTYLGIVGAVMVVSLLVALPIGTRLQARVTAPILSVTRVAHAVIDRRDFSLRAQRGSDAVDEPGYLVDAFNAMLAEIERRSQALEESNRTLQQAEQALREADRRKDEFLAMLAHELRNPLAPLTNAVRYMRRRAGADDASAAVAEMADRQLRQLARLVDDLLEVSRITQGRIELRRAVVPIGDPVRGAVDAALPMIQARRQTLSVDMPDPSARLLADEARLSQILSNLLNNASKYTDEGGRIGLRVRTLDDAIRIDVRDTGIGLPPEALESIFELFTQIDPTLERSQGGLGIGLALVRRLVEMHGGTVRAESAGRGKGSTFTVTLPRGAAGQDDAAPA